MNATMKKTAEIWGKGVEEETNVIAFVNGELTQSYEDADATVQDSKNPAPTHID
jgi:hypothetical protein